MFRNNRGSRRASMRMRLAVAAAVLVGGGAAGVVAVAASHGSAATAQSAGYSTSAHHKMSAPDAISSAMNGWSKSPSKSLSTLSQMTPIRNFSMMNWHHVTLAFQRGTVVAAAKKQFVVQSANRNLELWQVNRGTKILNVGASQVGMSALGGGTLAMPKHMNTKLKGLAKNDLVFVFGLRENHTLVAQLVLFVAPLKAAPVMTPTATTTPPVTPTAPVPTATAPALVPAPTSTAPTFSGHNS